jgi:LysR family hydrogen peroxide-inducible transcriptional activator
LSVHEPIAQSPNIKLVPFRDPAPSRQIALVWRKSSALDGFLQQLADAIGTLARAQLPQA